MFGKLEFLKTNNEIYSAEQQYYLFFKEEGTSLTFLHLLRQNKPILMQIIVCLLLLRHQVKKMSLRSASTGIS